MKSFWNYINDNGGKVTETIVTWFDSPDVEIYAKALKKENEIRVYIDDKLIARDEDELAEYFYINYNLTIHFCDWCGGIMQAGMTDDNGDTYVHEECFMDYMDDVYGRGKWMSLGNGEEDEDGGYYIVSDNCAGGYRGTGIYYTEWL